MLRLLLALALVALFLPLLAAHRRTLLVHLHPPVDPLAFPQSPSLSRAQRRLKVHETASQFVRDAQLYVSSFIRAQSAQKAQVLPLWIQNTLVVHYNEDDRALGRLLTRDLWTFPGVVEVEEDARVLTLLRTQQEEEIETKEEEVQSNVKLLHAPELWARGGRGDGVVVASIDSGVRYTHEALRETFRGTKADGKVELDYAFWFTPGTDVAKETPDTADEVGHGTHTMGSAVGGKGVGVAPGATWITARAFDVWGAANKSDFLLAAQWVVCPTRMDGTGTDCSLGADVVTNSFGVDRSTPVYPQWTWLSKVIDAWRAAGVYPVFASGNTNGFLCGSVYYPGSHEDTIAVGALIGGSSLWGASGKGPSLDGKRGYEDVLSRTSSNYVIKPDFVAPGVGIRSSMSIGDSVYTRLTGTSMSTPHVAGAIALLLGLDHTKPPAYEKILHGLTQTTTRTLHKPFLVPSACGNTTYHEYPNNIYGWGLPNVCLTANYLGFSCGKSIVSGNNLTGEQQLVARADVVAIE